MDGDPPKPDPCPWLAPYRWKPGQSGHPGGRPKGLSRDAQLRAILDSDLVNGESLPEGKTIGGALLELAVAIALEGDTKLLRYLLDLWGGRARIADPSQPHTDARDAWAEFLSHEAALLPERPEG